MGRSLGLLLALAGCGTVSHYRTAEPLGAGTWRASAAAGGGGYVDSRDEVRTAGGHVELALRRGVTDRLDVGAVVYLRGVALDAQLALGAPAGWRLAVAGGVGGLVDRAPNIVGDGVYGQARLSGLATRRTSPRWAFTVGPQLSAQRYWADGGGHASGLMLGAFANAAWQVRGRWALVPELSAHATLVGEVPVHGATAQLGVAIARTW